MKGKFFRGISFLLVLLSLPITTSAVTLKSEVILEPTLDYAWIATFRGGLARVSRGVQGGEWTKQGYIDATGKVVIPLVYDQATDFQDGIALVKKEGKRLFINKKGEEISLLVNEDTSKVRGTLEKELMIEVGNTKQTIPFVYDGLLPFRDDLAPIRRNDKYGLINHENELIVPIQYDWIDRFNEEVAVVWNEGKSGLIDQKGELVVPLIYNHVGKINEGLGAIQKEGKWGILKIVAIEEVK